VQSFAIKIIQTPVELRHLILYDAGEFKFVVIVASTFFDRWFFSKNDGKVICTAYDEYVLTHELTPAGPVPTALDPNGVYPYISYAETSNRPVPKKYHFVVLENDQLKATICTGLGGKVFSMIHKPSGKEVLYVPKLFATREFYQGFIL
jgi:hypothetical protein